MSKQDKSPKILQRDKFKEELKIRELNWTDKQKAFIDIALNKDVKMMFISGPAGSSKTLLSYLLRSPINKRQKS